jgi:hypothetical protein
VLVALIGVIALIGGGLFAVPFIKSLLPSARAKASSTYVIPLRRSEESVISRKETPFGEVWVLRRTGEQVTWLESHETPIFASWITAPEARELPQNAEGRLRSIHPEWFVFLVYGNSRSGYVVLEGPGQYEFCEDMEYFSGQRSVTDSLQFFGGLECTKRWGTSVFYDLTGRSNRDYYWPLPIPTYEIKDGEIHVPPPT